MAWALSRAVLRCHARRLSGLARSAPLPSLAAAIAVVAAPWPLARAGTAIGRELAPALTGTAVAQALVVGLALAGAAAGAAFAVACPVRSGLGPQLAAGPVGDGAAVVAVALVPAGIAFVAVLPAVAAFLLPLAAETPGGIGAGPALCLVPLAAGAAAAVLAEAAVHLSRGRSAAVVPAIAIAIVWAAVGVAFQAPGLGPLALATGAVAGSRSIGVTLAAEALTAAALTVVWAAGACRRPGRRIRVRRRRAVRLVRGPAAVAVVAAVAALVVRRSDLRLAGLVSVTFGIGGVAVGYASAAPPPAPLLLGATSALLGAALAPLALPGALLGGRWAWASAPRRLLPAVAALIVGVGALLVALVPAVLGALVVSSAVAHSLPALFLVTVLTAAAALVAGVVVPWRGEGIGDQLASFGAFAACGAAVSAGTGLAGPQLVAAGVPAGISAAAIAVTLVAVAGLALGCGIGRPR
jgi:hypothetical protein